MYFVCIMQFSNHNNFILLLQKCVYPYEYTADWKKFDKTSLPEEENFLSKLNMQDITDADYAQIKRDCKDFEIRDLGKYHDLHVQSNARLLSDLFQKF